jgi:hypothetical protein
MSLSSGGANVYGYSEENERVRWGSRAAQLSAPLTFVTKGNNAPSPSRSSRPCSGCSP